MLEAVIQMEPYDWEHGNCWEMRVPGLIPHF